MRLRQKACSTHYPPLKGEWLKELQECKSSPTGLMIATGSKGWNAETLTPSSLPSHPPHLDHSRHLVGKRLGSALFLICLNSRMEHYWFGFRTQQQVQADLLGGRATGPQQGRLSAALINYRLNFHEDFIF